MKKHLRTYLTGTALTLTLAALPAAAGAATMDELMTRVKELEAQVKELTKAATDAAKAAAEAKSAAEKNPSSDVKVKWKGAPEISSADGDWSIKVRGRVQADAGWVSDASDATLGGAPGGADFASQNGSELRRARLGVEGKVFKDFKYKFEIDFADNDVVVTDAFLRTEFAPLAVTVGQFHEPISMEEKTSSVNLNFIERAAFTDAWDFKRRLGVGADAKFGAFTLETGVYSAPIDADNAEDGYTYGARLFAAPILDENKGVHVGASILRRNNDKATLTQRYRQRPQIHTTNQRFIDTGTLAADGDTVYGGELAGYIGPFNASAEISALKADMIAPAAIDPKFWGGFVDVGFFLTGETRAYKDGKWDRVKPNSPLGAGGFGAVQLAARIDYLDLEDAAASVFGGKQTAYLLGLNWHPNDYVRFMANYGIVNVENGPNYRDASGDNTINVFGLRGQIDW